MNLKLLTNPKCACDHKRCCDEAALVFAKAEIQRLRSELQDISLHRGEYAAQAKAKKALANTGELK